MRNENDYDYHDPDKKFDMNRLSEDQLSAARQDYIKMKAMFEKAQLLKQGNVQITEETYAEIDQDYHDSLTEEGLDEEVVQAVEDDDELDSGEYIPVYQQYLEKIKQDSEDHMRIMDMAKDKIRDLTHIDETI